MLLVAVRYSVQLDHFAQLPPTALLAAVGIHFYPVVGQLLSYLSHHVSTNQDV